MERQSSRQIVLLLWEEDADLRRGENFPEVYRKLRIIK